MKKFVSILLMVCLLLPLFPQTAGARGYDPTVKIGLCYDSAALTAANLQNVTGMETGYAFGYYDEQREFVSTYEIYDENQVTVLKNANLWRSGSTYSDMPLASYDEVIGAYCLQVDDVFDLDDAQDVCGALRDMGMDAYLCCVRQGFRVRIGKYASEREAGNALNDISRLTGYDLVQRGPSSTAYTVVITGTGEILYQLDMLGDYPLGILPMSRQTWFKGYKYYGGFEYRRTSGNNLSVINVVSLTDYIKGVIPYEMDPSWPVEALKAQALCAKCYTLNSMGKHSSKGFDLCNTTDCQVYYGTNRATAISDAAVDATDGLYVLYNREVCQTYYHASSGGYTEDVANIWGKDIPYLKAVEDTYLESLRPFRYTLDLDDISWILQAKGYIDQDVTDLYVSKYSAVGNVLALTVVLKNGQTKTFTGDRARTALNSSTLGITIGSHRYTINGGGWGETVCINGTPVSTEDLYALGNGKKASKVDLSGGLVALTAGGLEEVTVTEPQKESGNDGVYVIEGTGSGHNIGMSQEGARSMAKLGFSCEEIIEFYFTGAKVDYYDPN